MRDDLNQQILSELMSRADDISRRLHFLYRELLRKDVAIEFLTQQSKDALDQTQQEYLDHFIDVESDGATGFDDNDNTWIRFSSRSRKNKDFNRLKSDAARLSPEYEEYKIVAEIERLEKAQSYLRNCIINRINRDVFEQGKSVFVSYVADEIGSKCFMESKNVLEKSNFVVRTGFQKQHQREIMPNIVNLIIRSSVFLGLWTPETKLSTGGSVPGSWMPIELGIAIALNKPIRLLIHEGVDKDRYLRVLPNIIHSIYSEYNFHPQLRITVDALTARYEEEQLARPRYYDASRW